VREALRRAFRASDNRKMVEALYRFLCEAWGISPGLGFLMPAGYEQAHASYDPDNGSIHLNPTLLAGSRVACAYYFLHEMRHAQQYLRPQDFPPEVTRGLSYVVQYDGKCFKRDSDGWKSCQLEGPEAYFTELYLAQPHELDAGDFAYETVRSLADAREAEELEALYHFWQPAYQVIRTAEMPMALDAVYRRIDAAIITP
jgi:hypothetical protein